MLQEFLTNFQTGWRVIIICCLSSLGSTQEIFAISKSGGRSPHALDSSRALQERGPMPDSIVSHEALNIARQTVYLNLRSSETTHRINQLRERLPRLAGESDLNYHTRIVRLAVPHVQENFSRNFQRINQQIRNAMANHSSFLPVQPGETHEQFRARIEQAGRDLTGRIIDHRVNSRGHLDTAGYYGQAQNW